jgi:hypothetical protein
MKLASLSVAALLVLMAIVAVTGDSGAPLPMPDPNEAPLVYHAQFALVPMTGRELIESVLTDEPTGDSNALPRDRRFRGPRSPEDQARGLSGSA